MIEALSTTVLGFGITLIFLYLLSLILDLMRVVFYKKDKKEPKILPSREQEKTKFQEDETEEDEGELIAVITSAILACSQKPADEIKIRLIRRINQRTPIWAMESRLNLMKHQQHLRSLR
ncbi:hypothetical protein JCM16816_15280 [Thermoanaerobacter brockii subsp. lactiethylicus]|jgi:sodium pump decarboxylase gamma subunit|uniref:Sodium pump decarboxylase, gamma subunit n=2 Tax=Thermoanaerobacter TaxID=1754 RepID=B0K8U9_THEP3|nr:MULTISPECIES: OadG family transporter subunit [Thermoanaerobacter]KUJ90841.1 MAG: sodium pump decarboxylase subunit gamma [Thermoanaerobacter thermocopriae]MDK2794042.1 glutaconyl-CoA/methylmalonyl-CoA decarboxylase subunit delta [Caldanaerobacter sp.]ABY93131.1 sodium pump decarboxylase, gamma subunit [Thermoanaerobacter sp. X514]ABY94562.1 sodium pump decarboxylase, gamma subunit [Thermoanaerobacter pseudethanolicus ATCC 33223]ADV79512.1 sodium pump decarboxylase, gamma subunit [Thermoana